ncbi:AraC family transcriptional regulator [Phyllobacterium sp. SB3]|uniref:helix-turn-helix domain-containing protein n=1 Tax=Phyllobacterium sp. SB3 TaxID=3156073 RepID=UPI0032AF1F75
MALWNEKGRDVRQDESNPDDSGFATDSASGRTWREVRPGMFIGLTDFALSEPLTYTSKTFPALCLSVVLEGYATNNTQGIEGGFCPNEIWISSTGECVPTSMTIHADSPVRVVELLLTPKWIEENEAVMGSDPIFRAMQFSMSQPVMVRRRPLDARLRQIAWSALSQSLNGTLGVLNIEACAVNMLVMLAEEFKPFGEITPGAQLSAKSLERVLLIRKHIDTDPVAIVSIAALATHFAISQSKLKQDFQRAFGCSARDYLMERRLLVGRNAILREGSTIAQAAYRTGYNHPANFTAAFAKHFGYPPSMLKP